MSDQHYCFWGTLRYGAHYAKHNCYLCNLWQEVLDKGVEITDLKAQTAAAFEAKEVRRRRLAETDPASHDHELIRDLYECVYRTMKNAVGTDSHFIDRTKILEAVERAIKAAEHEALCAWRQGGG